MSKTGYQDSLARHVMETGSQENVGHVYPYDKTLLNIDNRFKSIYLSQLARILALSVCWFSVGPVSETVAQHYTGIGSPA